MKDANRLSENITDIPTALPKERWMVSKRTNARCQVREGDRFLTLW